MQYIDIVLNVINNIFDWFSVLDGKFQFLTVVMGLFIIGCVYRFILYPVLGRSSGSSDTVKKDKKKR